MIKLRQLMASCFTLMLLAACGGGGVSDKFTREIKDVETAWRNAGNAFAAASDSVEQAHQAWTAMIGSMQVPDTLQDRLTPGYKTKLDSVKQACMQEGLGYETLKKELETARTDWETESKRFADWRDKVFKSEIDIETARKDLKDYQEKVQQTTGITHRVEARLTEIRQRCVAHHHVYNTLVTGIPQQAEQPRRRGRRDR